MCNIVTERFVRCVETLKEQNRIKSVRQFALSVDYHPQNLNDIMRGKRDVTIELIKNSIETYHFNPHFIFTGAGEMFIEDEWEAKNNQGTAHESLEKILYIPRAAHAGYTDQFNDPIYQEDLISFSLPDYKFQHGNYRCFDVEGDSMEPSLFAGDKVVCSSIDSSSFYNSVRDNLVYVVVLEGSIIVKRVKNNIRKNGTLEMISDNNYYDPYTIPVKDIREIWHVDVKISPFLPTPNHVRNSISAEMDKMKETIDSQSRSIQLLNQTIEKLLDQQKLVY